jgi:hypothetical protein
MEGAMHLLGFSEFEIEVHAKWTLVHGCNCWLSRLDHRSPNALPGEIPFAFPAP